MPLNPNDIVAALDVGDARVGIATTRVMVGLPQPVLTLTNDEKIWENLERFTQENSITVLVVGLPRGLEGQETKQTGKVRQFVERLKQRITLPVHLQDEAVTSIKAQAELAARGGRYNKGMVDALAATYILEDFLRDNRGGQA